jgi:hypothetical protein
LARKALLIGESWLTGKALLRGESWLTRKALLSGESLLTGKALLIRETLPHRSLLPGHARRRLIDVPLLGGVIRLRGLPWDSRAGSSLCGRKSGERGGPLLVRESLLIWKTLLVRESLLIWETLLVRESLLARKALLVREPLRAWGALECRRGGTRAGTGSGAGKSRAPWIGRAWQDGLRRRKLTQRGPGERGPQGTRNQ